MFSRELPWQGLSDTALCLQVMKGARPAKDDCLRCPGVPMSDTAWILVESCWRADANDRPDLPHIQATIANLKSTHNLRAGSNIDDLQPQDSDGIPVSLTGIVELTPIHSPEDHSPAPELAARSSPASDRLASRHDRREHRGPLFRKSSRQPSGQKLMGTSEPIDHLPDFIACTLCDPQGNTCNTLYRYCNKSDVVRHLVIHHGWTEDRLEQPDDHPCPDAQCSCKSTRKHMCTGHAHAKDLAQHIIDRHHPRPSHPCPIDGCHESFSASRSLARHLKVFHPSDDVLS
jgi:hypothetical protein